MCSLQIVCLCFNILLYFQIEKRWPDTTPTAVTSVPRATAPVGMSAFSALDLVSVSSRLAAAAPPLGLSPSPPPVSPGAAGSEAEELQPSGVQPELELDISLDDDSLLDFSDEHSSIAEAMQ